MKPNLTLRTADIKSWSKEEEEEASGVNSYSTDNNIT